MDPMEFLYGSYGVSLWSLWWFITDLTDATTDPIVHKDRCGLKSNLSLQRMEQKQKAYPRNIQYISGSLMVCIPSTIAGRFGLKKGQTVLVGCSDDLIIVKPMEVKLARKDLKIPHDALDAEKKPTVKKHDRKPDDPNYNPLERLRIK